MPGTSPRNPKTLDYLGFYVVIPLLFGVVATPFAATPMGVSDLGSVALYAYVCFRAIVFWIITDLACRCTAYFLGRYRLPLWSIFCVGFSVAAATIYVFVYVALVTNRMKNPGIAAFIGNENMGWNLSYILTVAGYAVPAFLVWVASAYGYTRIFNVRLFNYARPQGAVEDAAVSQPVENDGATNGSRYPTFLVNSRLPNDAQVLAIKAEEHYIRLWTDLGTDMQRYRFKDAVNEMSGEEGLQVHRSWWVYLPSVKKMQAKGRKTELVIAEQDLTVPVSLSYKQPLVRALEAQGAQAASAS